MVSGHEFFLGIKFMNTPTIEQLERALHIRGAIETLQAELATLLNGLADVVAPKHEDRHDTESKPPFADSLDGARDRRIHRKQKEGKPIPKPASSLPAKRRRKSRKRGRLWSVLTGGEVATAPEANEVKLRGGKIGEKSCSRRGRKLSSGRRKRARKATRG